MKTRFFHLYADGKRVKEITSKEYFAIRKKSASYKTPKKQTARVHIYRGKVEISISKGTSYIYVRMNQLLECMRLA